MGPPQSGPILFPFVLLSLRPSPMMSRSVCAALVCAMIAGVSPALAQETQDESETARFRWGPIRFTPTLEITSLGRDTNVFNEDVDPKSDFTAGIGPAVKLWMRPAGTRLSAATGGQYLYFRRYANQRAWNTSNEARWEVPLARLTPWVAGSFVNSRERQGYEIDSRSRRRDQSYSVGTKLRVSGKTELGASFKRSRLKYDDRETLFGATLAEALNRQEDTTGFQFRYALTPLTTFVTDVSVGRDRFDMPNVRDSDSIKVLPGFELKPFALISGRVFVGYRQFKPLDDSLPDYTGLVAAVRARYTYSATRLEVNVERDVAYSFEETQPYYALLDYGLTVTERITHRWDLVGLGSIQRLAYRALQTGPAQNAIPERIDRGRTYGGGVGYRLNDTTRVGFNVSHTERKSPATRRNFEGTRLFGSITYGTQQ